MFRGIVEQLGVVTACEPCEFGAILFVDPAGWSHRPAAGDSISVNGCCLTMTDPGPRTGEFRFDVGLNRHGGELYGNALPLSQPAPPRRYSPGVMPVHFLKLR